MARISGETIGSVNVFFFMAAFTIKQFAGNFGVAAYYEGCFIKVSDSKLLTPRTST
ncbi:MAG: hypothetical protein M3Y72_06205 [Acidobacteriota bacterium]|nr:hypothetical protein [Acidobacteriota bacterium]